MNCTLAKFAVSTIATISSGCITNTASTFATRLVPCTRRRIRRFKDILLVHRQAQAPLHPNRKRNQAHSMASDKALTINKIGIIFCFKEPFAAGFLSKKAPEK